MPYMRLSRRTARQLILRKANLHQATRRSGDLHSLHLPYAWTLPASALHERGVSNAIKVTAVVDHSHRPFLMKHLNEAVCVVRRHLLVDPSVLTAAGFNPS